MQSGSTHTHTYTNSLVAIAILIDEFDAYRVRTSGRRLGGGSFGVGTKVHTVAQLAEV